MQIYDFLPLLRQHLAANPKPKYGEMGHFIQASGLSANTVYKYLSTDEYPQFDRLNLLVFLKLLRGTHYPSALLFSILDDPMTQYETQGVFPMKERVDGHWRTYIRQNYTSRTDQWGFGITMKPAEPLMPENLDHFQKAVVRIIDSLGGPYQAAKITGLEYKTSLYNLISGRQKWIDALVLEEILEHEKIPWTEFNTLAESYLDEPLPEWKNSWKAYRQHIKETRAA